MDIILKLTRLVPLIASALIGATSFAAAQADPERPVTPPDSYRVVMENDRVRMIEIHVKPHSKVNVDSPAGRERFLYMLSDGALILAPPGKTLTSSRCMLAKRNSDFLRVGTVLFRRHLAPDRGQRDHGYGGAGSGLFAGPSV